MYIGFFCGPCRCLTGGEKNETFFPCIRLYNIQQYNNIHTRKASRRIDTSRLRPIRVGNEIITHDRGCRRMFLYTVPVVMGDTCSTTDVIIRTMALNPI